MSAAQFQRYYRLAENLLSEVDMQRSPQSLFDPAVYTLALGGKRIRPVLALAAAELFGAQAEAAAPVASAVELFHNFTLVHDDIMDSAAVRRGQPTVHTRWNANTAILSGDAMLVLAYEQLQHLSPSVLPKVFSLFNRVALDVCRGQQLDMDLALADGVSTDDYLEMIRLKTAVLLTASLQMGAAVAGAGHEQMQALQQFGDNLGLAFQLLDDVLDAFPSEDFGKTRGGDIMEGKRTYLLLQCAERANANQLTALNHAMKNTAGPDRVLKVCALYEETGALLATKSAASHHSEKALHALEKLNPRDTAFFRWLVTELLGRER